MLDRGTHLNSDKQKFRMPERRRGPERGGIGSEGQPLPVERSRQPETVRPPVEISTKTPEMKPLPVVDLDKAPDGKAIPLKELVEDPSENILLRGGKASGLALAFLGYQTGRAVAHLGWRMVIPGVDWFARKIDSLGDRLISKHFPLAKKIGGLFDRAGKWLGLDKTLFDIISKQKEERNKFAEKVLSELRADETKHYKQAADKDKKKARRADILKNNFGDKTAVYLLDEIDAIEKAES